MLARVPETGLDAAGAVAQLHLQIEVSLAVGSQLLVGDEKDIFDGLAIDHLMHETAAHIVTFQELRPQGVCSGL